MHPVQSQAVSKALQAFLVTSRHPDVAGIFFFSTSRPGGERTKLVDGTDPRDDLPEASQSLPSTGRWSVSKSFPQLGSGWQGGIADVHSPGKCW